MEMDSWVDRSEGTVFVLDVDITAIFGSGVADGSECFVYCEFDVHRDVSDYKLRCRRGKHIRWAWWV